MQKLMKVCDECDSLFYADSTVMAGLCPECAHRLYAYPRCEHVWENDRCGKCYWDGSLSGFLQK